MPNITKFALDNARIAVLFLLMTAVSGVFIYLDYPKQEDPSITIREAVVTASFPGMVTERVEDLITRPLEEKIREIGEVDEIKSDSKTGISIIHVTVKDEITELEPVWQDLRNKMDDIKSDLPSGTFGPNVNDEFGLTAVVTLALWNDGFSLAEMRDVARDTRDRLYTVKGVRKVELYGVQDERIFLDLDDVKLAQFGIDPATIFTTLQEQNIILPGGEINVEGQSVIIEPSGNFDDVEAIEQVIIQVPGTQQVTPLRDLVTISRGYVDPPNEPVFYNGKPAIVLSVSILEGVNSVEFGERLVTKVREIEQTLPLGYAFDLATYQPDLVSAAVEGAVSNLLQTLVIVLVVVMVFLGIRTGLIVGSFVPMAMLMGLVIMSFFEIEMQRMSIASMIIALGMLVDNGIVIAEDIRSRLERGEERRAAVLDSGRTLAIPLLTSSLTTILAFMPMVLAIGGTGEYTLSLGQVIIIVLLSSWFLAMFMTPLMCFWFMKVDSAKNASKSEDEDPYAGPVYRGYKGLLIAMLRWRFPVLALVLLTLVGTGYAFRFVVQEFFPASDRNQYLVYLDLPAGSHVDSTIDATRNLTSWLGDADVNPEVTSTIAYVGSGGPRFFLSLAPLDPDPHLAFIVVNTQSSDQVPEMVQRTRRQLLETSPDVRGRVKAMWLGASETGLVEVRLSGPRSDVLTERAAELMAALRAIPGTVDIKQDWENRILKLNVDVDQARARRAGITSQDVASALNGFISGAELTEYREGDTSIPVILRGVSSLRENLANIRDINIFSSSLGVSVPLSQIAEITGEWELSRIKRRDQERTITIAAKHQYMKAGQLLAELRPSIDALDLPPGHRWELGGELENSSEAQQYLFANMPLCFALIVVLLVWQFNSFRRPLIIMLTIPLTFIGAIVGLLVMQAPFGFMVILGLLSLAGIIINNGIVLIDRIDSEQEKGLEAYDAIIAASLARFRPILMTAITTALGLLPLIISHDVLFYGMAVVILFGLMLGTFFTLGVVPILYTLFFRVKAAESQTTTPAAPAAPAQ